MNKVYLKNKNISQGTNTCEYLVLHHTGKVGDGNINILAGLTNSKVSVHYLVRQDGSAYQFVDETKIAWHCGVSSREGKTNLNRYSIGIEIESDGNFYTLLQKQAVSELIKDIQTRYPNIKIIRHKDIAPNRKIDVSDEFWGNEFKTFEDYKKQFTNKKSKMTENEKLKILNSIYLLIDAVKPSILTPELKEHMEGVNHWLEKLNVVQGR